ncbi:hypothetical protein MKW94_010551, partial [Papaver nudicaule]|nr:hypothetical protein [Papaver nudicaule]
LFSLSGVVILLGLQSTLKLFTNRQNYKIFLKVLRSYFGLVLDISQGMSCITCLSAEYTKGS